ncbi:hypothetical protein SPRG_11516 [Saprolegnia parasitica CBS 223.65]|uniref:Uncharacterized protein n=1 Tax=Saprolegnia parasitica (strain CBS 223.65) TaxID=695850 RepID=A0A067BYR3_SAPPC|nr:hypothetical protein SPRG_11516 [Saprolegnia parasitica CBS 223.65]KDO23423.1 hypothetical protein SPRG_11516 [Saprolegnia parasitica CBS 223.65]|eukprot:XP_012205911.1 hypothetical protein SPRG_11516 [Saprolegnia parasitica CBS 223.65]
MNLEERLAHLQWRKVCNESQIQGALKQTKQLVDRDTLLNATESKDASKWVRRVVQTELAKPLEISLEQYEQILRENDAESAALERASALHANSVAAIQAKMKLREEHAKRLRHYRKHKQLFLKQDDAAASPHRHPHKDNNESHPSRAKH